VFEHIHGYNGLANGQPPREPEQYPPEHPNFNQELETNEFLSCYVCSLNVVRSGSCDKFRASIRPTSGADIVKSIGYGEDYALATTSLVGCASFCANDVETMCGGWSTTVTTPDDNNSGQTSSGSGLLNIPEVSSGNYVEPREPMNGSGGGATADHSSTVDPSTDDVEDATDNEENDLDGDGDTTTATVGSSTPEVAVVDEEKGTDSDPVVPLDLSTIFKDSYNSVGDYTGDSTATQRANTVEAALASVGINSATVSLLLGINRFVVQSLDHTDTCETILNSNARATLSQVHQSIFSKARLGKVASALALSHFCTSGTVAVPSIPSRGRRVTGSEAQLAGAVASESTTFFTIQTELLIDASAGVSAQNAYTTIEEVQAVVKAALADMSTTFTTDGGSRSYSTWHSTVHPTSFTAVVRSVANDRVNGQLDESWGSNPGSDPSRGESGDTGEEGQTTDDDGVKAGRGGIDGYEAGSDCPCSSTRAGKGSKSTAQSIACDCDDGVPAKGKKTSSSSFQRKVGKKAKSASAKSSKRKGPKKKSAFVTRAAGLSVAAQRTAAVSAAIVGAALIIFVVVGVEKWNRQKQQSSYTMVGVTDLHGSSNGIDVNDGCGLSFIVPKDNDGVVLNRKLSWYSTITI
jgi:hypothetical protein